MLQQPSLLQRLRYGAATRKMRDRYRAKALWRRWCVRRRGRHGTDGARGLGFDACCECLQISSSPTPRGAQSRCKPRHNRRASFPCRVFAWFSGRWCAGGCDDYCCIGRNGSSWVCQIDEVVGWIEEGKRPLSWAGEDSSLRIDRLGARLVGFVGQLALDL